MPIRQARAHRAVGISHSYIGYMLELSGDFAAASREHRAALAEHEWVAHSQPPYPDHERLLAVAHENVCATLTRSGFAAEAIPHCEAAVTIHRSMMESDHQDLQAAEDLAADLTHLSRARDGAHQSRRALEENESAHKLIAQALTQDPNSLDLAGENADNLLELAMLDREMGATTDARAAFQQAKVALTMLSARYPQTHMFRDLQGDAAQLETSLH